MTDPSNFVKNLLISFFSKYKKAEFLFGRSASVVPLQALLGLNEPSLPILASNYDKQSERVYRASRINAMSTNIAFIMYECREGSHGERAPPGVTWPQALDRYMIQLLYQETSTVIPNGCGHDICSYDDIRQLFSPYVDQCNFVERCSVNNGPAFGAEILHLTLAFVTVILHTLYFL